MVQQQGKMQPFPSLSRIQIIQPLFLQVPEEHKQSMLAVEGDGSLCLKLPKPTKAAIGRRNHCRECPGREGQHMVFLRKTTHCNVRREGILCDWNSNQTPPETLLRSRMRTWVATSTTGGIMRDQRGRMITERVLSNNTCCE